MIAAAACSTLETGHCSWKCIWKNLMILKLPGTSLGALHSFKDPTQAHAEYLFMIYHQTSCFKCQNHVECKCCSFQPFLLSIYAGSCCEWFQKGHRATNISRPVPVMSDGCTSWKLHWLAAYIYQKCTLLKIYYTQTSKPWNPPGLSALAFLIKGKHIKSNRFFWSHR